MFGAYHMKSKLANRAFGDSAVFKIESKKRPNYGKSVGMNPSEWWADVSGTFDIRITYKPLEDLALLDGP